MSMSDKNKRYGYLDVNIYTVVNSPVLGAAVSITCDCTVKALFIFAVAYVIFNYRIVV